MIRLICLYCDHSMDIDYQPSEFTVCGKCGDYNLRMVDLKKSKIDYYRGSPPFPDKPVEDKKEPAPEIKLEEPELPKPYDLSDLFF